MHFYGYNLCVAIFILLVCSEAVSVSGKRIMILQSKGGGHAEIGFSLAKRLLSENEVTILQDPACKRNMQPFCRYEADLIAKGVRVDYCDLSDANAVMRFLSSESWDVVIDNNNKDGSFASTLAAGCDAKQLFYVSSGGMYNGCPDGGAVEDVTTVKEDNACRQVEVALLDSVAAEKVTIFRPQYIYGANTNKRSILDWFFDRVARDMPVPMPGDGSQLVALSHVDDVTAMMCTAINNPNIAGGQVFNCGSDDFLSYRQVVQLVATALGKDPEETLSRVQYYDPHDIEKGSKPSFPFRATTFTLNPSKARRTLGWAGPTHSLAQYLPLWCAQYHEAEMDLEAREEDAAVVTLLEGRGR
jgi:nucleoside-diphosphate-sugar epimerase